MAILTAAWMATLRAMIGCRMAATGGGWSHPPPPEVTLLRIGAFLCVLQVAKWVVLRLGQGSWLLLRGLATGRL